MSSIRINSNQIVQKIMRALVLLLLLHLNSVVLDTVNKILIKIEHQGQYRYFEDIKSLLHFLSTDVFFIWFNMHYSTSSKSINSNMAQQWYSCICHLTTTTDCNALQSTTSGTQRYDTCIRHIITAIEIDALQVTTSCTQRYDTCIRHLSTATKIDALQLTTSCT